MSEVPLYVSPCVTATEREGNILKVFNDVHLENEKARARFWQMLILAFRFFFFFITLKPRVE